MVYNLFVQLYLHLSEIQTNHRRIVLVHCDKVTTKRVMHTAKSLGKVDDQLYSLCFCDSLNWLICFYLVWHSGLLDGSKIWILLDGVLGNEMVSEAFIKELNLPVGLLALHQRSPSLQNPETLFNIVRYIIILQILFFQLEWSLLLIIFMH